MKTLLAVLTISLCIFASLANSEECVTSDTPLLQLLNQYSQEHGTKFVVDPRVRARVTLVGIDISAIDARTLTGVLSIHGFVALTDGELVFVVPDEVAEVSADTYGRPWEG
jgi:type II secretory pathway component GspD/PulD (secretin)